MQTVFTFIDLFAGCGGLSLGLQREGGMHILAVEKSPMASETYAKNLLGLDEEGWRNHLALDVVDQMDAGLVVGQVDAVLALRPALEALRLLDIDVVAGGPPCQGFSLAGRRNSQDPRNRLAWEFLEFVEMVQPKFVLIENVVGMDRKYRSSGSRSPFESLQIALRDMGYTPQGLLLNAAHFGAPQSRPRMMILAARNDVARDVEFVPTENLWQSEYRPPAAQTWPRGLPVPTVRADEARSLGDAIYNLGPNMYSPANDRVARIYQAEMVDSGRWGLRETSGQKPHNHELRHHRSNTLGLFRLLQILTASSLLDSARRARAADYDQPQLSVFEGRVAESSFPLRSPDSAMEFSSAAELVAATRKLLTRKHSQTVLAWARPSRTVVTIPDDYVHPIDPRTFSVRELARLQGFPDDFEFYGKVTTGGRSRRADVPQYTQVGNAVSPFVAAALGSLVSNLLSRGPLGRRGASSVGLESHG